MSHGNPAASADPRLARALARIDAANDGDPTREPVPGGDAPAARLYGERMTAWLGKLAPDASDALQVAARAQHIRRWEVPRTSYPMTKPGYHKWRTDLQKRHAEWTCDILRDLGYDEAFMGRVTALLQKRGLKTDPETQTLEDVACLVFLEFYYADFAAPHDDDKVVGILQKTWAKMSARGQAAALTLSLPGRPGELVARALSPAP